MQYFNQTLLQNLFKNFKRPLYFGDIQQIPNNRLLEAQYFPNTTNLYGWNRFAQGTLANADWIGAENLTAIGTMAYTADHLGLANNSMNLDGATNAAYCASSTFDTANESFSCFGWVKGTDTTLGQTWISKMGTNNSFQLTLSSLGIQLVVYTGAVQKYVGGDTGNLFDGNYHFIAGVYNQADRTLTVHKDGVVIAHYYDAALSVRDNGGTSKLCFGGKWNGAFTQGYHGAMDDFGYHKFAMSPNEVRKLYAAGCRKPVTVDGAGIVRIDSKASVNIVIVPASVIGMSSGDVAITGWNLYTPEKGFYTTSALFRLGSQDDSGNDSIATDSYIYNETLSQYLTSHYGGGFTISVTGLGILEKSTFLQTPEKYLDINSHLTLHGNCQASDTFWVNEVGYFKLQKDI